MMPLVSLRLIGVAALLTVLALAGTVLLWRRWGRWRLVTRPVGILLFQVLLLLTVGLVVNRAQRFYPSWEALRGSESEAVAAPALPDGLLDPWVRERARPDGSAVVPWDPAVASAWKLSGPPAVTVPAGYLDRTTTLFPAVLTLLPAGTAAAGTAEVARTVTAAAGPAVVANVPLGPQTRATDLATGVPAELGRDLRLAPHSWALVAPLAEARRAADTIAAAPSRFVALALVGTGPAAAVPAGVRLPPAIPVVVVTPGAKTAASASAPAPKPTGVPADAGAVPLPCAAGEEWRTAVRWAVTQTPAALNQPVVLPALPSAVPSSTGGPR